MSTQVERGRDLDREGIKTDRVRWNLTTAALYEEAVRREEGVIAAAGPLSCRTGQHTGRSPNDKFIVREPSSEAANCPSLAVTDATRISARLPPAFSAPPAAAISAASASSCSRSMTARNSASLDLK